MGLSVTEDREARPAGWALKVVKHSLRTLISVYIETTAGEPNWQ